MFTKKTKLKPDSESDSKFFSILDQMSAEFLNCFQPTKPEMKDLNKNFKIDKHS